MRSSEPRVDPLCCAAQRHAEQPCARNAVDGCDVQLVEFAGCGHCPQEEAPQPLAELIAEFAATKGLLEDN